MIFLRFCLIFRFEQTGQAKATPLFLIMTYFPQKGATVAGRNLGRPILLLSDLNAQLLFDTVLWGEFEILAELPLDQDSGVRS